MNAYTCGPKHLEHNYLCLLHLGLFLVDSDWINKMKNIHSAAGGVKDGAADANAVVYFYLRVYK